MTNKKRYLIVIIISIILNEGFAFYSGNTHNFLWMDQYGVALAALVLEPAAGIIIAIINDFVLSIVYFDISSILYVTQGMLIAVIVGINMYKDKKISFKRIPTTWIYIIVSCSIVASLITLMRTNGMPDSVGELYFYKQLIAMEIP